MTKTTKRDHGLRLVLDTEDSDTPAMIYAGAKDKFSASWDCATGQGELTGLGGDLKVLTEAQLDWLMTLEDDVDAAFKAARAGMKEYE